MYSVNNNDSSSLTVLVVDDSRMIRVTAEKMLRNAGYEVVLATDGFDALSKVVECKPEVIILDITMPDIDGYQTCALIKDHKEFKDIPVIMLSGKNGRFDRSRSKLAGFNECLPKPFNETGLINAIDNVTAVN